MRLMHTFIEPMIFAMASTTALAADHPLVGELTALLAKSIDSDEVQALAKKYDLRQSYKFDSGSFSSQDKAYTLMCSGNRIDAIILRASPYPKGYSEASWTVYSHPLPHDLKATNDRKQVEEKLGKPTKPGGDRWIKKSTQIWIRRRSHDRTLQGTGLASGVLVSGKVPASGP